MAQFEQLTRERAKLNEELRPFHAENEQLRQQIAEFGDKRQGVQVCRRMQSCHASNHGIPADPA